MSNASNLSNLANVLDDGSDGQFLKSTGSGGVAFDTVAAGAVVYATADLLPLSGNSAGDMAYVTSTSRFYINNGSGWYSVSLVNTTPNITSVQDAGSNTTPFTLATDQTATVITITAADPEDIPLTYGYSVTSGSLNGSTVAQGTGSNTNVFTVTPHASQDATFTITFTASDGINQATSANAFSLTFVTVVTDSKYTTLLATAANTSGSPYSFSGLSYANKSFSFTSQDSSNNGLAFNPNGTKMYMTGSANDVIYQYSLNPAWDVSTASYDNVSLSMSGYSSGSQYSIEFKSDGSVMYISDNSQDSIDIYTVSSGSEYVLNQYSYNSTKSLSAISGITNLRSIIFKPDGSKFFALCNATNKVYEFTMSTYWDVANAQHSSSDTYDVFSAVSESSPRSAYVTPDGTQLLVSGTDNDKIHRFVLTSPWQVNSATYTSGDDFDFTGTFSTSTCSTMVASDDGTFLYLNTTNNDTVYQYNFTSNNNSTITDSSSNNHNITVNGDAYAGTFSPYRSGGYSMNFGSGASLKFAEGSTSDFNMGTNAFTIEMWIRPATTSSGSKRFYQNRISSMGNGKGSIFQNGSNLYATYRGDNGTDYELTASGVLTADTWTHVCLLRNTSDNTLKLYYNGTLGQSVSVPSTVGIYNSTSNTQVGLADFGDIANLRVVNGTAITPSSSSILEKPTNVTNTVLLMIGGNFVDYSENAPQINNYYGPPEIKAYGPLDYTEYSTTDHGGSVYFDGSGDTISTYHASNLQLGTSSAFTLELWFYANGTSSDYQSLFSTYSGSSASDAGQSARLIFNTSNNLFILTDGSSNFLQVTKAVQQKTWNHFCWTRDASNNHKFYFNGEQIGTSTASTNFQTDLWCFGRRQFNGDQHFTGYISDISLIKGSVTRSSEFTPPTAPLSSSGTSLHIKGTDASIIDKSQGSNLKLIGNTTGSTTQVKFSNTKSMYFDGSGDYITIDADKIPDLGAEDWTIETWFYTSNLSADFWILSQGANGSNLPFSWFKVKSNGGTQMLTYSGGNLPINLHTTAGEVTANTWHHIALTHEYNGSNGGTWRVYIDGSKASVVIGNDTYTSGYYWNSAGITGEHWEIAKDVSETSNISPAHYLQDLRITKGKARYTAADETSNIPSAPLEG